MLSIRKSIGMSGDYDDVQLPCGSVNNNNLINVSFLVDTVGHD